MTGTSDHHPATDEDRTPEWPYASLLFFGFFGADTRAGRRLAWRTSIALVAGVAAILGLSGTIPGVVPLIFFALLLPASVAAMGASYVYYLRDLDELARQIQLQALAFSYGSVMTIAASLFALSAALGLRLEPGVFFAALVLTEIVRGGALVHLARRHE